MKRKIAAIAAMLFGSAFLTGCGVTLTSKQNDLAAEYVAGLLVQRSFFYENKYIEPDTEPTQEETPTAVINPETESGNETEEPTTEAVNDVYDISGTLNILPVVIRYTGYKNVKEYPDDEDAMFSFTAEEGYKFIVAEFNLCNETDEAVTINSKESDAVFRLTINDTYRYNSYGTLLLNDISNIENVTIEAGGIYEATAVFMVPENVAENIEKMVLSNSANNEVFDLH